MTGKDIPLQTVIIRMLERLCVLEKWMIWNGNHDGMIWKWKQNGFQRRRITRNRVIFHND